MVDGRHGPLSTLADDLRSLFPRLHNALTTLLCTVPVKLQSSDGAARDPLLGGCEEESENVGDLGWQRVQWRCQGNSVQAATGAQAGL
jgi:hypothetical protein